MARKILFPRAALSDVLLIAETIWEHNAGKPMRRITIFDALNRQPDSGTSRELVTASSAYGLTQGGYTADVLALTERGKGIVADDSVDAKLDAVLSIDIFRNFFDNYQNSLIPGRAPALDFLKAQGVPPESAESCLNIILKNGRYVGLIQVSSGKERITPRTHVLELAAKNNGTHTNKHDIQEGIQDNGVQDATEYHEDQNPKPPAGARSSNGQNVQYPPLHIDIQIHIDANAKPEQVEHVFASMAKYLYGRE